MKVVLLCEGPTEGRAVKGESALGHIVKKVTGRADMDFLAPPRRRRIRGAGTILKSGRVLIRECNLYADAVVMLVDNDRRPRRERLGILQRQRDAARSRKDVVVRIALGVAIETFEAWLLADRKALKESLALSEMPPDEGSPEGLNGRPGSGNHPKDKLNPLVAKDTRQRSYVECVADIASRTRIDELTRRCPKGFEPFARELRRNLD